MSRQDRVGILMAEPFQGHPRQDIKDWLRQVINLGDLEKFDRLFQQHFHTPQLRRYYMQELLEVIESPNPQLTLRLLKDLGHDWSFGQREKDHLFCQACSHGKTELVSQLLDLGFGCIFAIHFSIEAGRFDLLPLLASDRHNPEVANLIQVSWSGILWRAVASQKLQNVRTVLTQLNHQINGAVLEKVKECSQAMDFISAYYWTLAEWARTQQGEEAEERRQREIAIKALRPRFQDLMDRLQLSDHLGEVSLDQLILILINAMLS